MGKVRIGISGWSYPEWRGEFYPDDLHSDRELAYAAARFDTIEVNGTFYSLTDPASCRHWRDSAPADFVFAVKGSRYITHTKRLQDIQTPLANFLASGILELGEKLGPILWQLPPNMQFDPDRLDRFLSSLPADSSEATGMAREHDDRVESVSYGPEENHRMRHVLEIRHPSFFQPETATIAKRHGVALCFSHSEEWPLSEQVTAGFAYIRLHGPGEIYASDYTDHDLEMWAERIEAWRDGEQPDDPELLSDLDPPQRKERDVYVYFDNTASGHAPRNALHLREIIGED